MSWSWYGDADWSNDELVHQVLCVRLANLLFASRLIFSY